MTEINAILLGSGLTIALILAFLAVRSVVEWKRKVDHAYDTVRGDLFGNDALFFNCLRKVDVDRFGDLEKRVSSLEGQKDAQAKAQMAGWPQEAPFRPHFEAAQARKNEAMAEATKYMDGKQFKVISVLLTPEERARINKKRKSARAKKRKE